MDEPAKDKQVRITKDWCLEKGDGYKINIEEAFIANRLMLGTIRRSYGAINFINSNPNKIIASNEALGEKGKNRICFTMTYNSDVIMHVLMSVAKGKS